MPEGDVLEDLAAAGDDARLCVLLADDDSGFRSLLVTLLRERSDVPVLTAADGFEALRLGLRFRPQVVVLDYNMPRMDGIDVARTLRYTQPSVSIALQSSDLWSLHVRASGLGLPLFDKLELSHLVAWTEKQVRSWNAQAAQPATGESRIAGRVLADGALRGRGPSSRRTDRPVASAQHS
jgi:CheY-like chemotaxis protein